MREKTGPSKRTSKNCFRNWGSSPDRQSPPLSHGDLLILDGGEHLFEGILQRKDPHHPGRQQRLWL